MVGEGNRNLARKEEGEEWWEKEQECSEGEEGEEWW
jgi:hypothetical protein